MSGLRERFQFAVDHRWGPGRMSAYLDGDLGAGDRARMERHTGRCPQCRRILNGLRQTVALLRAKSAVSEPAPLHFVAAVRAQIREVGG
jgi:anti-sigma factor RsiW